MLEPLSQRFIAAYQGNPKDLNYRSLELKDILVNFGETLREQADIKVVTNYSRLISIAGQLKDPENNYNIVTLHDYALMNIDEVVLPGFGSSVKENLFKVLRVIGGNPNLSTEQNAQRGNDFFEKHDMNMRQHDMSKDAVYPDRSEHQKKDKAGKFAANIKDTVDKSSEQSAVIHVDENNASDLSKAVKELLSKGYEFDLVIKKKNNDLTNL